MVEYVETRCPTGARVGAAHVRLSRIRLAVGCASVAAFLSVFASDGRAYADPESTLDIPTELNTEGVQLLAVEFYASWCPACVEAIPRWKALHEKYRARGLRFVVVAVRDPKAGCPNPGWIPDKIICDEHGAIAERFGVKDFPKAFLWDWTGDLLVHHAHVDAVEQAIGTWWEHTPTVSIETLDVAIGSGLGHEQIHNLLRQALMRRGKLQVALPETELQKIRELRATRGRREPCAVDPELPANAVLQVSVRTTAERRFIQLHVLSAESGCLVAATASRWDPAKPETSVVAAADALIAKLSAEVRYPWGAEARKKMTPEPLSAPRVEAPPPTPRVIVEKEREPLSPIVPDEMVEVPAGNFISGCSKATDLDCTNERLGDEFVLPTFSIDRTEVTVASYRRCIEAPACNNVVGYIAARTKEPLDLDRCNWLNPGREHHPMNCVTRQEAAEYCAWMGKRLPTMLEWMKAAKGIDGRMYPWAGEHTASSPVNLAKFANTSRPDDGYAESAPVGAFPSGASPYGVLDMIGNAEEFVLGDGIWSTNDERYAYAVGGSWRTEVGKPILLSYSMVPLVSKDPRLPDASSSTIGFRCAKSKE